MAHKRIYLTLAAVAIIAFCTSALPNPIDRINGSVLREYSNREFDRGAPALNITSRVLYKDALETLERGDWEQAREMLLLSASLSGDYPDPMFTLARIELLHADTDFLPHLFEGFLRLAGGYNSQSLLAANAAVMLVVAVLGALFVMLVVLLIKYWPLIDHWIRERYSKNYSFPPEKWIGFIIIIALLIARVGLALYIALLIITLWTVMNRRERSIVVTLVVLLSACSFLAGYSNAVAPALDPDSATRRLSLINERGGDGNMMERISEIDEPGFTAERDFALGTIMYRLGLYDDAKRYLLGAVAKRPDLAPAFLNLGNIYFVQKDFDKALAGYQNVIAIDPGNAPAHYNIGQTYIQKMLFAQSSSSLEKATELGIESYKSAHPIIALRDLTILEQGFDNRSLWKMAFREGAGRERALIGEILKPYILFPFNALWILLVASTIASVVINSRIPRTWKAFRCDNCHKATCPECADNETGINLCRDCSGVIQGLTSIKVMEALLRHRRQKTSPHRNKSYRWKTLFFPGASHVYFGRTCSGVMLMLINICAVMFLVWRGLYFKDPYIVISVQPLWKIMAPAAILALGYMISLRVKASQEPRNYRILPQELRIEKDGTIREELEPEQTYETELVGSFIDSL